MEKRIKRAGVGQKKAGLYTLRPSVQNQNKRGLGKEKNRDTPKNQDDSPANRGRPGKKVSQRQHNQWEIPETEKDKSPA